jgi:hypothetical protein
VSLSAAQLWAEVACWPWAAPAAFEAAGALSEGGPGALRRHEAAFLDDLAPRAGGRSADQLRLQAQATWARPGPAADLLTQLQGLAAGALTPDGPALRTGDRPADLLRWRALTAQLPPELLAAAHPAGQPTIRKCAIRYAPEPVQVVLARGTAEGHAHLSSARRFVHLWQGLHQGLATGEAAHRLARAAPDLPRLAGQPLPGLWAAAALVRAALWAALDRPAPAPPGPREPPPGGDPVADLLAQARRALLRPGAEPAPDPHAVQGRAGDHLRAGAPPSEEQLWASIFEGQARLSPADRLLALQYLRLICCTWRLVVQQPGVPGLDWFRHSLGRMRAMLPEREDPFPAALAVAGAHPRTRSVELRVGPPATAPEAAMGLLRFAEALRRLPAPRRPEAALVVHFLRPGAAPAHRRDDGTPIGRLAAFEEWIHEADREMEAIERLWEESPESTLLLRGLDVASRELALPLWPTLEVFRRLRAAHEQARRALSARHGEAWELPRLRATVHQGEEHRAFVDGLRRVDELIEQGVLGVGDRVGHGLVLGIDAEAWARRGGACQQPQGERLDDLCWLIDLVHRGVPGLDPWHAPRWSEALQRLGQKLLQERDPLKLREARRLRHHPRLLAALWSQVRGYQRPTPPPPPRGVDDGDWRLAWRWLTDEALAEELEAPLEHEIEVAAADAAWLEPVQRAVAQRCAEHHLTIEANPSSNLLIGPLPRLRDHPMFRLQPLERAAGRVPVSLNCDNHLASSTSLELEYALTWAALVADGHASEVATDWLERARHAALNARFTLPESAQDAHLDTLIDALRSRWA